MLYLSHRMPNLCGITKRWNVGANSAGSADTPQGRAERGGKNAGTSHSYNPDPDHPNSALPPNFLEKACENSDFIDGAIDAVISEISDFVKDHTVAAGGVLAGVAAVGGTSLLLLIPQLIVILAILNFLRDLLRGNHNTRFGEVMDTLRDGLLNTPDPATRIAGIFVWQCIAFAVFSSEQKDLDFAAISYAVMDKHNYSIEAAK